MYANYSFDEYLYLIIAYNQIRFNKKIVAEEEYYQNRYGPSLVTPLATTTPVAAPAGSLNQSGNADGSGAGKSSASPSKTTLPKAATDISSNANNSSVSSGEVLVDDNRGFQTVRSNAKKRNKSGSKK